VGPGLSLSGAGSLRRIGYLVLMDSLAICFREWEEYYLISEVEEGTYQEIHPLSKYCDLESSNCCWFQYADSFLLQHR